MLLPLLMMHAGVIITRYKMVHDGKKECQRIKNKRPRTTMLPFGERVEWMMPKDNQEGAEECLRASCQEQDNSWF